MRTYPTKTNNKNVPANVYLIAESSQCSGEIITTYYADEQSSLWAVNDWKSCKPYPVYPFEVCRLTGDNLNMIVSRIESHFRLKPSQVSNQTLSMY